MCWSGVCVSSGFVLASCCSCFHSVVALRIELSAARLSAEHGQPALDDLFVESGTSGSNRKPPAPKAGVLPSAPLPDVFCQQPVWESNPSLRLERAVSCADRRTGRAVLLCAHTFHAVDWEALESSSPALQAGARPSQLPVRVVFLDPCCGTGTKKARCRVDTGLCVIRKSTAECHKRNGCMGSVFACS